MTKLEALKILSEITPQEGELMQQQIAEAAAKIRKRRNHGKMFPVPFEKWKSRNTRCPTCGGIHTGFRCPLNAEIPEE